MKLNINAVAGDEDNNDDNNKLFYKTNLNIKPIRRIKLWNTLKKNIQKLIF